MYAPIRPPTGIDEGRGTIPTNNCMLHLTNEELFEGDWAKGPSGTNEEGWASGSVPPVNHYKGVLAENWEMPDPNTIVFHIRKGVHWALDQREASRLVNGRELDANDVVFTLKRNFEDPKAYLFGQFLPQDRPISIAAPDKWSVVIKCPEGGAGALLPAIVDLSRIIPREVIDKYGDMTDWRNIVGTGPFILTDFVAQSSMTFKRNPNYWGKDPFHPESQLPYLDCVRQLIMPDISTRIAALRTGMIDREADMSWENSASLQKTNPELKTISYAKPNPYLIWMRVDTKPFDDIKVRRALAMGIDRNAIVDNYFSGQADILAYPILRIPEFMDMYTPIDKLPPETREIFEYHPDKAKQLLAEAGYPAGFKNEVVCSQEMVDMLSIIKADWAKIGVDLKIDVREYTVFMSIFQSHAHKYMIMRTRNGAIPFDLQGDRTGTAQNQSIVSDPRVDETFRTLSANFFNESVRRPIMKEISLYILSQCWWIQFPSDYLYCMWQPWLKGYSGETQVARLNHEVWPKYVWLDQALKQKMIGK